MHREASRGAENRSLADLGPPVAQTALRIGAGGVVLALVYTLASIAWMGGAAWTVFFRSYILNLAFVVCLALGALFFVIIQHLVRAGWSVVVRRIAEFVAGSLPTVGLLFLPLLIPLLFNMAYVYPWTNPEYFAKGHDESYAHLIAKKSPYLSDWFFIVRCAAYALIWTWLSRYFLRSSLAQDANGDPEITRRMQIAAGGAIVLFAFTTTFFAFDVLMSLLPEWYSTIFGVYFFAGANIGFYALLILSLFLLQRAGRLTESVTTEHYHDIGKLMFAFTVFWTYIAFSQYMLIWYANLPEETPFYAIRQKDGWWVGVSFLLLFGKFVGPFLLLLSRWPKRRKQLLVIMAGWCLFMQWIDIYYLVGPSKNDALWPLNPTDVLLLVGLGGLFVWAIVRQVGAHSLIPARDPRLAESLAFENY